MSPSVAFAAQKASKEAVERARSEASNAARDAKEARAEAARWKRKYREARAELAELQASLKPKTIDELFARYPGFEPIKKYFVDVPVGEAEKLLRGMAKLGNP